MMPILRTNTKIIESINLLLVFADTAQHFLEIMQNLKSEIAMLNCDLLLRSKILFIKVKSNLDKFDELEFILKHNNIPIVEFTGDDFYRNELIEFLECQRELYEQELRCYSDCNPYIAIPEVSYEFEFPNTQGWSYCGIL